VYHLGHVLSEGGQKLLLHIVKQLNWCTCNSSIDVGVGGVAAGGVIGVTFLIGSQ